jgi:hypothetical protein
MNGRNLKIILVYMHEEQSLVVVVKSLSQISTKEESPWPSNLLVLHGHATYNSTTIGHDYYIW